MKFSVIVLGFLTRIFLVHADRLAFNHYILCPIYFASILWLVTMLPVLRSVVTEYCPHYSCLASSYCVGYGLSLCYLYYTNVP
jgi:hypothetical protein